MLTQITTPGSKSITNRALILSALSNKTILLKNTGDCDDISYMIQGLRKLGIKITKPSKHSIKIIGNGGKFKKSKKPIKINTGNAGTTTRFLTALATLTGNEVEIDGDERMKERPIKELTKALNSLGAKIETTKDCPPVKILPTRLQGGEISLPGNISSQYLSALLLVSPFAKEPTIINIEQKLCSKPYIKMTISLLQKFGVDIVNKNFEQFKIDPSQLNPPKNYNIESDTSSASYIGAYAALHNKKSIKLDNINKDSIQGDIKFIDCLKKIGCEIKEKDNGIEIQGPKTIKSLGEVDMNETPDLVMTFAILAMFSKGTTHITNIENLRIKETDRIAALKKEIKKFGIEVKITKSSIKITGNPSLMTSPPTEDITIETYNDHRIAMCFGIIKDIIPNLKIKNPKCVSKSYATFWKDLKTIQAKQ